MFITVSNLVQHGKFHRKESAKKRKGRYRSFEKQESSTLVKALD